MGTRRGTVPGGMGAVALRPEGTEGADGAGGHLQ